MKRAVALLTGFFLTGALFAFTACDENGTGSDNDSSLQPEKENRLLALDKIDLTKAFGDTTAEDWSFALGFLADMQAKVAFSAEDAVGNVQSSYSVSADAALEYALGLSADKTAAGGVGIFGSGTAGLSVEGDLNGKALAWDFSAAISSDAGKLYATTESERYEYELSELVERVTQQADAAVLEQLYEAVDAIPTAIKNGFGLRFGVEKLLEIGFVAEVDTSEGTHLTVRATKGLFTTLINELLEAAIPSILYMPKMDVEYRSTVFELELDFDEEGKFEKFALNSDVDIGAALRIPYAAVYRGGVELYGGFEISAIHSAE